MFKKLLFKIKAKKIINNDYCFADFEN